MQLKYAYDFDNTEDLRKDFLVEVEEWKDIVHKAMQEEVGLDPQLVKNVAVVPAGHYNIPEIIPGDGLWLSRLWKESVSATRPLAQPAFVKLNAHLLAENMVASQPTGLIHEQPLVLADIGKIIGRELGVEQMGYKMGFAKAQEMLLMYYLAKLKMGVQSSSSGSREINPGYKSVQIFNDQELGVGSSGRICKAKCGDLVCAAIRYLTTSLEAFLWIQPTGDSNGSVSSCQP